MSTAFQVFQQVPLAFFGNDQKKPLDLYVKCIRKILKDENLMQIPPPGTLPSIPAAPLEILAMSFDGLTSFFRDGSFNQENAPDGYKLINEFRPNSSKEFSRFTTPKEKLLLKALQIYAGFTLGLIAWEKKNRATTAKRYQETLELAATYPPWNNVDLQSKYLDRWAMNCVQQVKDNLAVIIRNDTINAQRAQQAHGSQDGNFRRDVVQARNTRVDAFGDISVDDTISIATDSCGSCGKREVKLSRCSKCKKVAYCGRDCQTADWKSHKAACHAPTS
ncbi:hypothetical protein QCA50_015422 [Cerrena zonata]|uniref:MYND-type domain-containing protein n=1 Tax=Cerrena zonata TaxID=2478898 RepID=A0AAW0FVG5_9APHY